MEPVQARALAALDKGQSARSIVQRPFVEKQLMGSSDPFVEVQLTYTSPRANALSLR